MSEFLEIVFGLPTVIFTTLLLISLGFWIITIAFGLGDGGDLDLDAGGVDVGDVDVDVDVDAGGSDSDGSDSGTLAGLLQTFNLHILPLTLTFSIISLVAWFVSAMGTVLLTSDNSPNLFIGLALGLTGLVAGVFVAGRVGQVLRPIFVPTKHIRRRDLIGRLCTVHTGRVDADFGAA